MKRCSRGGHEKPLTAFYRRRASKDGLDTQCIACRKLSSAEYYAKNGSHVRNKTAAYKLANPDWKRDYDSAYQQTEAYRDYQRIYRTTNRAQLRQQQIEKYAADAAYRMRRQVNATKRRARMENVQILSFTDKQLAQKFAYWNNCCWVCGSPPTCMDHVKPIAAGGAHMLCNLRPICLGCNNMKKDKWPLPSRAAIMGLY